MRDCRFWLIIALAAGAVGCGDLRGPRGIAGAEKTVQSRPGNVPEEVDVDVGLGSPGKSAPPVAANNGTPDGSGEIQVFFSQVSETPAKNKANPNSIARYCADFLSSARKTLDIACHEIDNEVVIKAVLAAKNRGVEVRVITETDYMEDAGPKEFAAAGIPVNQDRRKALMHNKFAIVDGVAVWTGSFNFTENCAYKNNNNGFIIRNRQIAQDYSAWFEWFLRYSADGKGHMVGPKSVRVTPFPTVNLRDGTRLEVQLTSFDKMDQKAIEVIRSAKRSIKFLAFSFTHKGMSQAMASMAEEGVKVVGVFEARNLSSSEFSFFQNRENCTVYQDGNRFNMHHKVIIVDDSVVLAGSYNFSANATTDNDENYVVISNNRKVAAQFVDEFNKVVQQAAQGAMAAAEGKSSRSRR